MSEASKTAKKRKKVQGPRPNVGRSAQRRNGRTSVIAKAKDYVHSISFKVYGEDAQMARVIGNFSNFSNICLFALRAYYKLLRKFYGTEGLLSLKTDRVAPPPYEYLLVPIKMEKFQELAALSGKLESKTGKPMGIEQLMARAVDGTSIEDLAKMADPFPGLTEEGMFRIYSEHMSEIKTDE